MQIAWATDIHLDKLHQRDYLEYKEYLVNLNPDCLIISGDIAEGEKVCEFLTDFDESLDFPIYFVLGNHDYYFKSFNQTEKEIKALTKKSKRLNWLTEQSLVELSYKTVLIGVESWGDARNGTFDLSEGASRDLMTIADYKGLNRDDIKALLQKRGEYYAEILRPKLDLAIKNYQNIIFVTHVPPFVEICFDRNLRICGEFKLPFYTCKAVGDLLLETMKANPNIEMTVLCGHTHETADAKTLDNLRVRVKESGYGSWWDATMLSIE